MPSKLWKPGQSGNPGGRPKGVRGLQAYIREITEDGFLMADIAWGIATNEKAKRRDRLAALQLLLDRMLGKPHVTMTIDAEVRDGVLDLMAMTPEQRADRLQALEERKKLLEAPIIAVADYEGQKKVG